MKRKSIFHDTPRNVYATTKVNSHTEDENEKHFHHTVRQAIWPHVATEDHCVPSWTALQLHWKRCEWVLAVWRQARQACINVPPLEGNGWIVQDGTVNVVWDTPEGLQAAKDLLENLTGGCKCKTGCTTRRCRCRQAKKSCNQICKCSNCANQETTDLQQQESTEEPRNESSESSDTGEDTDRELSSTDTGEQAYEANSVVYVDRQSLASHCSICFNVTM